MVYKIIIITWQRKATRHVQQETTQLHNSGSPPPISVVCHHPCTVHIETTSNNKVLATVLVWKVFRDEFGL